jgi:hypothetical protein
MYTLELANHCDDAARGLHKASAGDVTRHLRIIAGMCRTTFFAVVEGEW